MSLYNLQKSIENYRAQAIEEADVKLAERLKLSAQEKHPQSRLNISLWILLAFFLIGILLGAYMLYDYNKSVAKQETINFVYPVENNIITPQNKYDCVTVTNPSEPGVFIARCEK